MTAVLEAHGLTVRFGGHTAVSAVDLAVPAGVIVGLIGPNGAGKTTTFNALTGLIRPNEGRVRLDGADITRLPTYKRARRGLARTFQRLEVFTSLSVADNVRVAVETRLRWKLASFGRRWDGRSLNREVAQLLDTVGLTDVADDDASSLSTGTARLLEVARALASRPKVLLLDEPASGLDGPETDQLASVLRTLASNGMGILMVEHDMDLVMQSCSDIYVLDFGQCIAHGSPAAVRSNRAVMAAYLGDDVSTNPNNPPEWSNSRLFGGSAR